MQKRVILSVTNDVATDQRVMRSAFTLQKMGYKVLIVGRNLPQSLTVNYPYIEVKRFKLLFNKGPLFYVFFNLRLFCFLLFNKADLLFSNDLDTLWPNFLVSKIKRSKLIYDSHEYFTGVPELAHRPFVRGVWQKIEQFIFPRLKNVITVNDSIAELFNQQYSIKPQVVRNVPMATSPVTLSDMELENLKVPFNEKIIIMQGSGINIDRGAEEAVEAMQYVNGAKLLIIGGGDVFALLPSLVKKWNVGDRVFIREKVAAEVLKAITAKCFVGLTLDKSTNINYRLSLPNKLFDYLQAGIPVVASNLTEVSKIVNDYKVGTLLPNYNAKSIAEAINTLATDVDKYARLKVNAINASKKLCWEQEQCKFIEVVMAAEIN